jgi:DNA invertase Pin-like site-specific DNA recombinase
VRAVLLSRVSTTKDEQASSSDRQVARLEEVARHRGWQIVATFVEEESGRSMKRPAIAEAIELVRRRKADLIAVDHLFRFGRNAKEMLETVDLLNQLGGALYEADKELDTTGPLGRLVFTILAGVGEFYARNGSQKIKEGLERARAKGKRIGRERSIDYSKTPRARELRAGGASWSDVAGELGGSAGAWSRRLSRAVG